LTPGHLLLLKPAVPTGLTWDVTRNVALPGAGPPKRAQRDPPRPRHNAAQPPARTRSTANPPRARQREGELPAPSSRLRCLSSPCRSSPPGTTSSAGSSRISFPQSLSSCLSVLPAFMETSLKVKPLVSKRRWNADRLIPFQA